MTFHRAAGDERGVVYADQLLKLRGRFLVASSVPASICFSFTANASTELPACEGRLPTVFGGSGLESFSLDRRMLLVRLKTPTA